MIVVNPMQAIADMAWGAFVTEPVAVREMTKQEMEQAQKKIDSLPDFKERWERALWD